MDKTYFYIGLGMFILELLSIITYFIVRYINWSISLAILLIVGFVIVVFNLTAFILMIKGIVSKEF